VHRAENTDDSARLSSILTAFDTIQETIVLPIHPRTRKALSTLNYTPAPHIRLIEPVGYLDMVMLEQSARMILTDSGGVQKEAYWLSVPCITLRDETEWVETIETRWNMLAGTDTERIVEAVTSFVPPTDHPSLYGSGQVAEQCIAMLEQES
jgi:UDP-N-acetylglucosamine 2-epimerase